MPSRHVNFEYDIFISYRQNDNKRDGWVTHFVEALEDELGATLKEPVSIYFDENPHDGLLETHQVSESLNEKLRCLIFIPILSQTYCDTSSYAWNKEFLPFLEMARDDEIGLNVKLRNGNVSSRILPVRIHDLDPEDEQTLAGQLGGPVRAIDFIYAEPGVNRPLSPTDNPDRNQNGTIYRNQINKVANALKEIGGAILNPNQEPVDQSTIIEEATPKGKRKKWPVLAAIVAVALLLVTILYFTRESKKDSRELAVAVLAFDDNSPTGDQEWLGNGVAETIINSLNNIEGLKVIGKRSSFSYKDKDATIRDIGEELEVFSVLEGSVSKVGDRLRINAQLIDTETEVQIWDEQYDLEWGEIHKIMDDVAEQITESLIEEFPEISLVYNEMDVHIDPEAYEYYLKGVFFHWDRYIVYDRKEDFIESEKNFLQAIEIDSSYIDAIAGLADLYDTHAETADTFGAKRDSLIDVGYRINPESPYLLAIKGFSMGLMDKDSGFYFLNKAYSLDPDHELILTLIQNAYVAVGLLEESAIVSNMILTNDPLNRVAQAQLAISHLFLGNVEEAKVMFDDLVRSDPNTIGGRLGLFRYHLFYNENLNEAKIILDELEALYPEENGILYAQWYAVSGDRDKALELSHSITVYCLLGMKEEAIIELIAAEKDPAVMRRWTYLYLISYPAFDLIRNEPEFIQLLENAKNIYDERKKKYGGYITGD